MYPELLYTDTQLNGVARDYYSDTHFVREFNGDISLWKMYNLLTAAKKRSHMDLLLPRAANASHFRTGKCTGTREKALVPEPR